MTTETTADAATGAGQPSIGEFAVPVGYVLVPVAITPEMQEATMAVLTDVAALGDGAVPIGTTLPGRLFDAMVAARPVLAHATADVDALEGLRSAIELIDCFGNGPGNRSMVLLERKDSSTFELVDGRTNKPVTLSDLRRVAGMAAGKGR